MRLGIQDGLTMARDRKQPPQDGGSEDSQSRAVSAIPSAADDQGFIDSVSLLSSDEASAWDPDSDDSDPFLPTRFDEEEWEG